MRNFWERRERELEGEERNKREERVSERFLGLEALFFIFLTNLGTLEGRGPRSSVARFQILPFAVLGARGAQGRELEHGSQTSRILVFLLLLISNTPQAIILHLFTFTDLKLMSINFKTFTPT